MEPQDEGGSNGHGNTSGLTLGLVPSPVYSETIVKRITCELPDVLRRQSGWEGTWDLATEPDPLTGANVDIGKMLAAVISHKDRSRWDVAVALTDLPIREHGVTIIAEGQSGRKAAVLSVPALGVVQIDKRVMESIAHLVCEMGAEGGASDSDAIDIRWTAPRAFGTVGLLAGMVYANRPWSLFPSFKTTVATAFATGGYGLIFTTLWEIGNIYGYGRLVTLMVVAMTILVSWIIIAHQLWETNRTDVSQYQRSLYNATTVATIAVGVVFAYVLIFVLLLLAAVVYIPTSMLESTIDAPVMPMSYVRIAWVTASVATIAGAIGAGLEDSEAVRNATFGWRQINRWREYSRKTGDDSGEE